MKLMYHSITLICILVSVVFGRDTVVVATEIWPPFRINSSPMSGIDVDVLHELGKKINVTFVFKQAPWARCLYMMETGQVDVVTGLAWTKERANYISYCSKPYYVSFPAFYYNSDKKTTIKTYNDLKKYSIGYSRSSAYFEPFNSDNSLNKIELTDESTMLKMLVHQRVDVIIGTNCQVEYDLAQQKLTGQVVRAEYIPDSPTKLFIGISKKSKFNSRFAEVNRAVEMMVAQKRGDVIASKYFNTKPAK